MLKSCQDGGEQREGRNDKQESTQNGDGFILLNWEQPQYEGFVNQKCFMVDGKDVSYSFIYT